MEQNEENLKTTIGKNIGEYRKLAGFSQLDFAEKLNYSDKAVSKWERGESLPDIIVLKQIADLFGITVNDLIGDVSKKKKTHNLHKFLRNKIFIMLLSTGLVFLIATIAYVFLTMFNILTGYTWLAFIYALPICSIICMVFSGRWKQKLALAIFESIFVWTLALSICLSVNFAFSQIWLLLIIAVPMQVLIILWNWFTRKKPI
ncbi:MAG: helix-turn-helix transcriptional regulator [Clostridiales bacterium]|nr:helix-turn-helix transcriptional regulator [Clostridiales bacterium]